MENNKEFLMKHFASILRGRAMGKHEAFKMNPVIAKSLSRKELIQILKKRFEGTIPKEHNLLEMENEELLSLIGDEMYIISYITEKWSQEVKTPKAPAKNETVQKTTAANSKKDGVKK